MWSSTERYLALKDLRRDGRVSLRGAAQILGISMDTMRRLYRDGICHPTTDLLSSPNGIGGSTLYLNSSELIKAVQELQSYPERQYYSRLPSIALIQEYSPQVANDDDTYIDT